MDKEILFSGIQPSGDLTIGNYIGAIHQWVKMQSRYQCIYCIVDLHAITQYRGNFFHLRKVILDTLALCIACGVDPDHVTVFVQSHVLEHSQLYWLLNCLTYFGELNRMTQFKNKLNKSKEGRINIGLFNYPVLMAADILLYQTSVVPVGNDQMQHLELTRDIARRFNHRYGPVFVVPEIFIPRFGSRIMSLLDPEIKMSKSDKNVDNVIRLLDDVDVISKKIEQAVTDSDKPPVIRYDPIEKPGISNLLEIFSACVDKPIMYLEDFLKGKTYFQLKNEVISAVQLVLTKIQSRYYIERSDECKLCKILHKGADKAKKLACDTMEKVHKKMGFLERI